MNRAQSMILILSFMFGTSLLANNPCYNTSVFSAAQEGKVRFQLSENELSINVNGITKLTKGRYEFISKPNTFSLQGIYFDWNSKKIEDFKIKAETTEKSLPGYTEYVNRCYSFCERVNKAEYRQKMCQVLNCLRQKEYDRVLENYQMAKYTVTYLNGTVTESSEKAFSKSCFQSN